MSAHRSIVFACLLLTAPPVTAHESTSFEGLWAAVSRDADCKQSDFVDFILFTCEQQKTLWYFTKPNHSAHPGVIKRYLVQREGVWYAKEDGHFFGPKVAQLGFERWLAQINDLDLQAKESLENQRRQSPATK